MFRVVTQDHGFSEEVDAALRHFESTSRPSRADHIIQVTGKPGEGHTVYMGCYRRARGGADSLVPNLIGVLNQAAIGALEDFAVHASVVIHGGRVIAFPAASGGGKTTLAAASLRSGADYLSDEALVLDAEGNAIPYPKPMALSRWSCERLGLTPEGEETLILPEDLDAKTRVEPAPLTDLVLAEYGHETTFLEPLPRSQALATLISLSFNHYKDPERAFRLTSDVARNVNVWRLRYDDPVQAAEVVAGLVG